MLRSTGPLPDPSTFASVGEKRARILIVDDEESMRRLLGFHLGEKYACEFAADGEEAISMLAKNSYDVAMIDMVMPKVSGVSLLRTIRTDSPAVVAIMMTGVHDSRIGIEAIRHGAFDFISKPFGLDEVEMSVERAVHHKRILDEAEFYQNRLEALVVERTTSLPAEKERL
jgi:two-component system response regulator PilR (NtrC family)